MTLDEIKCELCNVTQTLFNYKKCGINCREDYLENRKKQYYRYIFLKNNVSCGTEAEVDCIIENNK